MVFFYAELSDIDRLYKISMQFERYRGGEVVRLGKEKELYEARERKYLQENLIEKYSRYFVCEENGVLIAYIFFFQNETELDKGYIGEIFVKPEIRKKGIASILMAEAINYFKKGNCKCIELNVERDNKVAKALYKKIGFLKQKNKFDIFKLSIT